jgi:hypothetical protein
MNRVQWLREAEISRLEELLKQPSADESQPSGDSEELRADSQRARPQKKRNRR